jgi:LytS/YehU family sensor histidine kinase
MNLPPIDIFFHWLVNTPELLQRACVVVVVTYLAIRMEWLRRAIRGTKKYWKYRLITALFFGILAIFGTYNGIVLDTSKNGATISHLDQLPMGLQPAQAILSFRDMMVLSAGLCAGPWVGFCAGLIAGIHRYLLGSYVGLASGLATVVLGVGAGLAQQFWANSTKTKGTIIIALVGTAIQKLMIILFTQPHSYGIAAIQETVIPGAIVDCIGCLLFVSVMKDLERERLKTQAQQAELRALHAQIEPHFINNTLNAIKALIRRDPEQASNYVVKLARFLDETRQMAKTNSISLTQELAQLENYLEFQQLRFPGAFSFKQSVPVDLASYQIPPRCLLTLAENALLHGMRGNTGCLNIRVTCSENGNALVLRFTDNGCGMATQRIESLGKQPVNSERGSGNGLLQLHESLKLAFDGIAKMAITSQEGLGTEVTLHLPKRSTPW